MWHASAFFVAVCDDETGGTTRTPRRHPDPPRPARPLALAAFARTRSSKHWLIVASVLLPRKNMADLTDSTTYDLEFSAARQGPTLETTAHLGLARFQRTPATLCFRFLPTITMCGVCVCVGFLRAPKASEQRKRRHNVAEIGVT